jgi:hypothetical protein
MLPPFSISLGPVIGVALPVALVVVPVPRPLRPRDLLRLRRLRGVRRGERELDREEQGEGGLRRTQRRREGQERLVRVRRIEVKGSSTLAIFASVSPSAITPLTNCFLCFSRAIRYMIMLRKQLGGGAVADGETDAKNRECRRPLKGRLH